MSIGNGQWVEIEFECLPLRSITRLDIPVDASPNYEQFILRVKKSLAKHAAHNSYYLHGGRCRFHLTNDPGRGMVETTFEGTVLTDAGDVRTRSIDMQIELKNETCDWLNARIVIGKVEVNNHLIRAITALCIYLLANAVIE